MKELKELLDEKTSQLRKITDERDLLNDKLEEEKKERADQVRSLIKTLLPRPHPLNMVGFTISRWIGLRSRRLNWKV